MLQELSDMDRITQLQDEIQKLLHLMANSINHLTTRVNFVALSDQIPVTKQRNPAKVDTPDEFEANKRELVDDLIKKANEVEHLIKALPPPEPEDVQERRLVALEAEMQQANADYIRAVARAKSLYAQVCDVLKSILDEHDAPG
ncbi:hypothetical protein K488DRAFT_77783 [Vararia minispora EC-137]|uniref:Uncharacterized protein n=1 Tax=Vararia minispora EC-137 TaxID=1314806 RepID=A0ACB8QPP1_9AGAM|nr:hypothetical protein K488DRAFT_77783 [Vararia minispora EC-137]